LKQPQYHPPLFFNNGHIQTIYPSWFRKFGTDFYTRERIDTSDGDFLDLDWSTKGFDRLAIVSHGLEGDSHRAYVVGMVKALNANRWDAMAWNFRSCSGEVNRQLYSYHSGWTQDLEAVIEHAKNTGRYKEIALISFSLGHGYPVEEAGQNKNVTLEMPESGGHTGFIEFNKEEIYWSEKRAVMFLNGSELE
jgi:predicted alpha/beta-fold hydrolase